MHQVTITETAAGEEYPTSVFNASPGMTGGIEGRPNTAASLAAASALAEGKTLEEAVKIAQEAYEPEYVQPSDPEEVSDEDQVRQLSDLRRYLLAIVRYGNGNCIQFDEEQLLDIACCVQLPCPDISEWKRRRGL